MDNNIREKGEDVMLIEPLGEQRIMVMPAGKVHYMPYSCISSKSGLEKYIQTNSVYRPYGQIKDDVRYRQIILCQVFVQEYTNRILTEIDNNGFSLVFAGPVFEPLLIGSALKQLGKDIINVENGYDTFLGLLLPDAPGCWNMKLALVYRILIYQMLQKEMKIPKNCHWLAVPEIEEQSSRLDEWSKLIFPYILQD